MVCGEFGRATKIKKPIGGAVARSNIGLGTECKE
jgi:hypothetical protein